MAEYIDQVVVRALSLVVHQAELRLPPDQPVVRFSVTDQAGIRTVLPVARPCLVPHTKDPVVAQDRPVTHYASPVDERIRSKDRLRVNRRFSLEELDVACSLGNLGSRFE